MITVRLMERRWDAREYGRLSTELLAPRVEDSPAMRRVSAESAVAAALAMIRLEELNQAHAPLYGRLLQVMLKDQQADGGWGDPLITALVLRALLGCRGAGAAVDGAMAYLARMQREDGAWPAEPLRRMPGDPFVTGMILFQLAEYPRFRDAVRVESAYAYMDAHAADEPIMRLLKGHAPTRRHALAMN